MATFVAGGLALMVASPASAQTGSGSDWTRRTYDFGGPASAARATPTVVVPRTDGRLTARQLGLVINTADPYSVEVGEYYARARRVPAVQVLRVALPVHAALTPDEFKAFAAEVDTFFGTRVQALALAWTTPYAVACNSITGALALGFDAELCRNTCAVAPRSRYFNAATSRPYADLALRPSMLLAARDATAAKAMIQRGIAADGSLGLRGATPVNAYFVSTDDAARSVRAPLFPEPGLRARWGVDIHVAHTNAIGNAQRVLLYETGAVRVAGLDTLRWVPGALADHLTSFGGVLDSGNGQMSALDWLASGATASYGTVSEPCAHQQKFPHPQVLLLNYLQGATALEAYWKSVAWPQQGVFIGEPLAAPFARR